MERILALWDNIETVTMTVVKGAPSFGSMKLPVCRMLVPTG
jgi:hypothetical protein